MLSKEKNEASCLELVEAATELAERNQLDLAAETFLEAAECFDRQGDRSRSARYLTAAAEFFEMLGDHHKSSRCYGKAILRHLLANEVDNGIIVFQKAHLLGATNSMFNFLLARKHFEQRGINVEQILERAEEDLSAAKIQELKEQISKSPLETSKTPSEVVSTPTSLSEQAREKKPSIDVLMENIPELEPELPEFELLPIEEDELVERTLPKELTTPVMKSSLSDEKTFDDDGRAIPSSMPIVTNFKVFKIQPKTQDLTNLSANDQDIDAPILVSINFDDILELKPIEDSPKIDVNIELPMDRSSHELETLESQLTESMAKPITKPNITFSVTQKIQASQQKRTPTPTILQETLDHVLNQDMSPTGMKLDEEMASQVQEPVDTRVSMINDTLNEGMSSSENDLVIPSLSTDTEPIQYVNIHEIIPEADEDVSIPELVVKTTISPQWEVLDAQVSGLLDNAEILNREITDEGEIITWQVREIRAKNPITIQYTLRRRFQRIIYWRVGNEVRSATTYHSVQRDNKHDKWLVEMSFVNTYSQTISEVLIEDVPPPELLVEHVDSTINQDPKHIVRDGLTRFQWYQKRLEPGEKITTRYFLAERPLSFHFIDDYLERFTGQRIRMEKIVEPRTMGRDLRFFVLYRVISSSVTAPEMILIDHYPPEFTIEKFMPQWETLKYEEQANQKRLKWTVRTKENKGIKTLLLVMKGSQNHSPRSPTLELKNWKVIESKELERKIKKKTIDLKALFGS